MAPSHVCPTLNRGLQEFAKAARADVARRRRGLHHKSFGLILRLQQQCQQLPALRLLFVCIVLWASGPIAAGQVTNVQFYDEDPAWYRVAGVISWDPPADVTGIRHYLVHPACSPDLSWELANNPGGELLIVHHGTGGTLQDVPVGTNSIRGGSGSNDYWFKICSNTVYSDPWAAYFVVATMDDQNVATSYGVGHCYDYRDAANGGTVPDPPPLLFGSFADTDADAGEVGGTLTWTVDGTYNYGTYDFTLLSDYAIYLALDTDGNGRFELATVEPGSLSYTIPDNTDQQTATCLLMYGQNRLGLSATPSFSHCFEAASGSFTSTTVTSETLTTSITTTNTIDPSQAIITNVGFTDTSGSGYWIDGTVTWVAPNNPAFEYFRIVMAAISTGADAAVMVDNLNRTARSYEIVHSDARGIVRGTNTGGIWANYIIVQAYRSGAFSPSDEAGSLMLTDISNVDAAAVSVGTFGGYWAGLALVDTVAFTDGNPAENLLTGTVSWTFSATTDYGFASNWQVYIADDTQGTNRQLIGTVAKDLTQLSITDQACDPTHVYVLVYANNEHGESPNASFASFWDYGRPTSTTVTTATTTSTTTTLFTVGVGNVQFTDTIDTYFFIGGVLTWEEPADTSGITEYRVRLVFDVAASREQLVYEPDLGFVTAVPVGTTRFKILDSTSRRFACCDPVNYPAAWLIVYIVKGSIVQEAIYAGHVLIRDNQTTQVADSIYVQDLQLVDTTPEAQINITLTGELYWNTSGPEYPNVGEDWSLIDQWDIYLAQGSLLSSTARYIASVPLTSKSYIFTAQPLNQGDDTIIIYASNAVGKAPFGSVVQFGQFGGLQTTSTTTYSSTSTKPHTSMSGLTVTFTDTDTNAGTLLGTITWESPADPSALTSYDFYMSSDQQGSNQQQFGLVPSNTNSYTPSSPATRTTGTAFPANWLLVYPSMGGTISTYIDAASLRLYDNSGAVPDQPSFDRVTFTDEDPAGNFASGTVRWTPVANTDFGHITHYAVYLAEDQAGLNKVAFGDPVTWDVTEVVVGTGIELSRRYHVVIYAVNTYGESLQPGNIASSGGTSIIFGDLGQSTTTTTTATVTTTRSSLTQTGTATSTSQTGTATSTSQLVPWPQTGTATSTSQDASGEECVPTAASCPGVCVVKTCIIVDYGVSGEFQGAREECLNADVACPCGRNAMMCGAGQESYCLPRDGLSRCPLLCPDGEEPCYRPSFDAQGNRLPTEETCVPIGTGCGCGQGSFVCSTGQGEPECLPVGGYCPACAPGEIECPLVQNFFPNGTEESMVPPGRQCAGSLLDCPCGREATMCAALNRCIFKDAACCAIDEKTCVVADYTPDGNITGDREICWALTAGCPCGANAHRCAGAELCLPASQKADVCPCEHWENACEITEYSAAGIPERTTQVCLDREVPCPCGQNSLRCPDPLDDANGRLCMAKVISGIANSCPTPCSQEELARGSQTCVQIDLFSETLHIQRTSCLPFGLCEAGTSMKSCPSGAAVPVRQPCQLGRASRGNTSIEVLEVATAIIPMDPLQPDPMESLAAVGLGLRFLLEIPNEMTTAISLSSNILSFAITGPARSGQLGSAERRLQGNAGLGTWEDPSDILRLRGQVTRRSPALWQVLEPVGVPLAFASIDTQHISLVPEEVDDKEVASESEGSESGPADVVVLVVIASLCATLAMLCMVLGFGLFRRFKRGRPNKMGAGKADRTKDLQDIAVSGTTQDEDEHVDLPVPVEVALSSGQGGRGDDDRQSYPSQHRDVVLNDSPRECDQAVADDVEKRRLGLLKGLRHIPVVAVRGEEVDDAAKALALGGWEFYASPEDQTDMLRCHICLRKHSVFAFLHRPVEPQGSGGGGEPRDEKQRTRTPPEASQTDATTKGMFDPYTSHSFYCSFYRRPEAEPGAAKTKQTGEVAEAEKKLQDAMASEDLADLKAAIAAAKKAGVSLELRERALEVHAELLEAKAESPTRSVPSTRRGRLIDISRPTPIGVQVCQACQKIYDFLQEPERSNGDDVLEDLCRTARLETAPPDLKSSIFGLMRPEDIKSFLQAPDHQFWQQIKQNTEEFIKLLNDPGAAVPYSVDEMTPEANNPKVRSIRPVVMDQSVREPATSTPFGHTGYQKFLTLQIVKCMGFKDIAISGQYYGASYTPETQVLEWMKVKGVPMDGMIVMFAPGKGDREAGIKAIKDFGIPNAFLDLTMKASVRFKQSDFVSSVLETVEILDEIFTGMGFAPNPWRSEEKVNCDPGEGEISVNLVDLMEFLDLKPDGTMDDKKKTEAEDAFRTWKKSDAFRRRVVGILTEEGRGVANYKDYGALSRWLRLHFPRDEEYRILVHAHGGDGNTQDAASVEAALEGANGVWAALIPQAAQSGHNSSMVFLDNMLQMGNGHVLEDFWLHQGAQCARHIYYLNFNSYALPDDCPIWGARVDQLLHTAFSTVSGEEWRRRRGKYYDIWGDDERAQIGRMTRASDLQHKVAMCRSLYRGGNYRISPLVSDIETWRKRIVELGAAVVGPRGRAGDHVREVRDLGFALMNAGIRANMNEQATLKQLWDIATRNKTEKIRCDQIAAYLKAQQHQGEKE